MSGDGGPSPIAVVHDATDNPAAAERRRAEHKIASDRLAELQAQRLYGVVVYHLQAGRITRCEVRTSELIRAP